MRPSIVIAITVVLMLATGGGYFALEAYSAKQIRTGLDRALATLPPGTSASYRDANYSIFTRKVAVSGLAFHAVIPGPTPQPVDVAIETMELANPNPDFAAAFAKAEADPGSMVQDTVIPFADSIDFHGLTIHSSLISTTSGFIRVSHPRFYPWALLHDGVQSWQEFKTSLVPGSPWPIEPALRVEAALVLGMTYDSYDAGPMKGTETLPGIVVAFEVGKVTGGGIDRGVMKAMTSEAMTGHGVPYGSFTVDRFTFGETDIRAPLSRIVSGEPFSLQLLNGMRIGRIEYAGMTVQPPGKPAEKIGGMSIGPVAFDHGMPVSGQLALTDFSVSKTELPDIRAQDAFDKLGLDKMTMSIAAAFDWDVPQNHLSIHDTMLKVNELGFITLAADITNVTASIAGLNDARVAHARLRFEDASLVDRMVRAGAAQSGADPTVFRQQIALLVRQQANTSGAASPVLMAAGQAAGDFIASPHSLTIELAPPEPFPLMALQGVTAPSDMLAGMLGLTVSANTP
jgi:hypothetical protein